MCKFCQDESAHMLASTSSKPEDNTPRVIGADSNDDGDTAKAEKGRATDRKEAGICRGVKDEMDEARDGVEGETAGVRIAERARRPPPKRERDDDSVNVCADRLGKRCRSEEPLGPADQEAYEARARVVGLVSNMFTLVVSLEQTTRDVVGRSNALLDLRDENTKLKTLSAEKMQQNDDLTRVLWTVRDEYYKLKAASAKAQEKSEQLSENLRMLTKDHDTLMRERNRARAMAEENAKKTDELQRVLWAVRGDYYKLKSNLEKAEADAKSAYQRNEELSQQTKDLTSRNEDLALELKKAKEENEAIRSQANLSDSVAKELADLRADCDRLRDGEHAAIAEINRQIALHADAKQGHAIAVFKLDQSKETAEQLRRQIQEALDRETKLTSERDRLLHDKARLGKEIEKITDERDRYRKSHEQTIAEKGRLERAILKTEDERKRLAEEKEKFVLDWDRLIMQRDQAVADRDFLRVERDAIQAKILTANVDKSRAEDALRKEKEEKEALVAERDELLECRAQVAQLSQDKTLLRMEVGRLLDREAKQRIEDTLQRTKNAELYDALLKENVELRARLTKIDKSLIKSKAR